MNQPLICMTLTGKTLEENLKLVRKYEKYIDKIFKDITKLKNVTKFEVVKLSLNEIFIKEVLKNA